jgi:hypothetical protein
LSVFFVVLFVIIGVAILVAIVMSFFVRRHGESAAPANDWQRTDEVFVDPTTNRRMRVWVDTGGARHYVDET